MLAPWSRWADGPRGGVGGWVARRPTYLQSGTEKGWRRQPKDSSAQEASTIAGQPSRGGAETSRSEVGQMLLLFRSRTDTSMTHDIVRLGPSNVKFQVPSFVPAAWVRSVWVGSLQASASVLQGPKQVTKPMKIILLVIKVGCTRLCYLLPGVRRTGLIPVAPKCRSNPFSTGSQIHHLCNLRANLTTQPVVCPTSSPQPSAVPGGAGQATRNSPAHHLVPSSLTSD